jgi:hypothetical protein
MMPRMLYDRLDELGLDFGVIYPTAGLGIPRIADDATRRAVIRGFNIVTADFFAKLEDRLTPVAVIPMHTPEEAIEELEFVVKQLGAKVCMFGSGMRRRMPQGQGRRSRRRAFAVLTTSSGSTASTTTTRSGEMPRARRSRRPSIPAAAATACATARATSPSTISATSPPPGTPSPRALFLGGVTRRFPDLQLRLPRRRRRLGLPALLRPDRALGAARRQGPREHGSREARPEAAARAGRQIRLRPTSAPSSTSATAGPEGRGFADRRRAGARRLTPPARSPASRTGSISSRRRTTSAARPTTG